MTSFRPLLLLAALALAYAEEEIIWKRGGSRPRRTQSQLEEVGVELEYQGGGFVPGHVGEGLSQGSVPGDLGLGEEQQTEGEEKKNIRKQYISGGVGSIGSYGGGAGLAGVGPVIPGGYPAAFGGTASHGVGGPCGGAPCLPPPPIPAPPPPPLIAAPAFGVAQQTVAYASCPGGKSLEVECDVKRPWPQCPPQSYCYATNTVDVGPYVCCPIWSTYGSKWRPRAPFYPYYPPMPYNWAPEIQATAGWPRQVAPAVAVPVVSCAVPPCGGGPAAFGARPYRKKTRKVLRKVLKGKKKTVARTQAKAD